MQLNLKTKRRIGIQGIGVSISDEDVDWEKNVPSDYQGIINRSSMTLKPTTKKELYFLLCIGILIDDGRKVINKMFWNLDYVSLEKFHDKN